MMKVVIRLHAKVDQTVKGFQILIETLPSID